jgi:hypothetical protein
MKKILIVMLSVLIVMSIIAVASADWNYGIGTGLFRLNVKGDIGMDTIGGPVIADTDLNPKDFDDYVKTAAGFGGYATDGTYMIQYAFSYMELEADENATLPGGIPVSLDIGFIMSGAEVVLGYPVHRSESVRINALGGLRYSKHELSQEITIGGSSISSDTDNSWTDVVIGATFAVPFAEKWSWDSRLDAGFGGSEGTYTANTGATWLFKRNWSTTFFGKYSAVEFEHASKGDSNWYLYDVAEYGVGFNILYHW